MKRGALLLVIALFSLTIISCGGSGGGGGGSVQSVYTQDDLIGTWNYTMTGSSGSVVTGTMTIARTSIVGFTNSSCSQIADGWIEVITDTYVKGRNSAWCSDTSALMKFALTFQNNKYLAGIMDYHPASGGYKRYTWEMHKVN